MRPPALTGTAAAPSRNRGAKSPHDTTAAGVTPWLEDRKPALILILGALLPCLQRWFGATAPEGGFGPCSELGTLLRFFTAAALTFGALPAALIVLAFRERRQDYGLTWGDAGGGLRLVAILLPLITLLCLLPASRQSELRQFYPLDRRALVSGRALVELELARGILFYPAWEFFFRGFLLFGLRRRFGDRLAVCAQAVPSCLWHLGLPAGELLASLPGGILFGALALRTRSIFWPWMLHVLIGVTLDLLIVSGRPAPLAVPGGGR